MSYIGNNLQVAYPSYRVIDDISSGFNGVLKTFALRVAGSTPIPFPINPQQCLLSVNNIVQKPDSTGASGFTLTGSDIVFATAPTAGWSFFGTVLAGADYVNVGANFPSGTAEVPSVTFDASTGTGLFLASSNVLGITTGGVQRLVVNSSGFVGIGTTSPARKLDISNGGIRLNDGYPIEWGGAGNYIVGNTTSNFLVFSSGGNERVRIDSSGRVGIGTTTAGNILEARKDQDAGTKVIVQNQTNGASALAGVDFQSYGGGWQIEVPASASFTNPLRFGFNGTERARIDSSGNVGIGTSSPAYRLDVAGEIRSTGGINALRLENSSNAAVYAVFTRPNQQYTLAINSDNDGARTFDLYDNTNAHFVDQYLQGASGYRRFFTNGAERARIDSSGRLLVGTSTTSGSAAAIQIVQGFAGINNAGCLLLSRTNNTPASDDALGEVVFGDSGHTRAAEIRSAREGGTWTSGSSQPTRLTFSTTADGAASTTERMRIGSSGQIMVGTTNTNGNAFESGATVGLALNPNNGQLLNCSDNAPAAYFNRTASDGALLVFNRNGTEVGKIQVTTTATSYITSSDYRLKENVTAVTDAIDRLQQLKPSCFNFIADPDKTVDGFIAHEAQAVVPECVTGTKDAVDDDGNPVYQGIDQSKLVPLLTAALQEAIGRIESLEAEVAALKAA